METFKKYGIPYKRMKKKVTLTIDEDVWNFMEKNFTNKSAFLRALIIKYYTENHINVKPKEIELPKESEEVFNEGTA
jgi:hypothetical protein